MKMGNEVTYFIGLVLYLQISFTNAEAECKFWNELAHNISEGQDSMGGLVNLACNSSCTSIDCSGRVNASHFGMSYMDFTFCMGLRLDNCVSPISLSYYMNLPGVNYSREGTVNHNDEYQVPMPSSVTRLGRATAVIDVQMVQVNATHLRFGIEGTIKVSVAEGLPYFPFRQETVIPPTLIDVPPCGSSNQSLIPYREKGKCTFVPPKKSTTKAPVPTTPPVIKSATYGKSCELGLLYKCSDNEMCSGIGNSKSKNGQCVCDAESFLNPRSGYCEKKTSIIVSTLAPKIITSAVPGVTMENKSKDKPEVKSAGGISKTGVIIAGVAGTLLLIVVAVSVIIFIGRRKRRANYRDRHQLLSDDDDDDPNVVI
ncbi:uncharacterized protein LOC128246518 isoform X2 [Mya arenaria]|uniref:uncharacterized protein LOC128246518 isoform X2 n=2 Tax=Mya arenaria TaxID=6604 RepID=UPI0022E78CFF|nr:uncharacterized protein LOC128246518 isoform X2 [Mya arenaria]